MKFLMSNLVDMKNKMTSTIGILVYWKILH